MSLYLFDPAVQIVLLPVVIYIGYSIWKLVKAGDFVKYMTTDEDEWKKYKKEKYGV